ncbi:MAG: glutathione S-transferase [Sandaracinaceae bacterium]|nr:glutathione S-transferase [Sandaracinaceae bacterium]
MLPVLYTFLRCPYAIRARTALASAGIEVRHVEVSLREKPAQLLALSPKGTVPVLHLADGEVLEESLDIMRWALQQNDPSDWLRATPGGDFLIERCDRDWKPLLDRYKYAERHPSLTREQHRETTLAFLNELESRLRATAYLCGADASLADVAIFPFVRQFSRVEPEWFTDCELTAVRRWLEEWLASNEFHSAMAKRT